jgi:endonuclease I
MWQRGKGFALARALVVTAVLGAGVLGAALAAAEEDWYAVALSDTVLSFGAVTTGESHSLLVTITNDLDRAVEITGVAFEEGIFSTDLAGLVPFEIPAHTNHNFHVYFSSEQNINYADFLRIELDGGVHPLVARVTAQAQYPDAYYACTQNKWAEELKDSLTNLIDGHTALGYNLARDSMYASIDNVAGWVECVYTGRKAFFNTRAGATANGFNCEHTWPQSFFSEAEPMKSDIFHLYPTDEAANSMRGNLDFGVVANVSWSVGGSKLGTDAQGQLVFEPRGVHKGNVARSHFYYIIRYNGAYDGYQNATKMESHFRVWHLSDPVDSVEQARNQHIYTLQHNRNPFIDHPELVERISSFFGIAVRDLVPEIAVAPEAVSMDTVGLDSTAIYHLAVLNSGTDTLHVSSVTSSNPAFEVVPTSFALAPDSYGYISITYESGGVPLSDSTRVTIASDDADESSVEVLATIEVGACAGVAGGDIDGDGAGSRDVRSVYLCQNSPNPFFRRTTIAFDLAERSAVEMSIYNVKGELVSVLLAEDSLPAGTHSVAFVTDLVRPGVLPAGIYYCRLVAGDRVLTRPMVLLGSLP